MFAMQVGCGQNGSCDGRDRVFNNQQSTIINQHNSSSYSHHHIAVYLHATHAQPPAFYHTLARSSAPIQVDVQGHDSKRQTKRRQAVSMSTVEKRFVPLLFPTVAND